MSARGKGSALQVSFRQPSTVTDARVVVRATAAASSASLPLPAQLPASSHLPRCTSRLWGQGPQQPSMACTPRQDPLWRKVGTLDVHRGIVARRWSGGVNKMWCMNFRFSYDLNYNQVLADTFVLCTKLPFMSLRGVTLLLTQVWFIFW